MKDGNIPLITMAQSLGPAAGIFGRGRVAGFQAIFNVISTRTLFCLHKRELVRRWVTFIGSNIL